MPSFNKKKDAFEKREPATDHPLVFMSIVVLSLPSPWLATNPFPVRGDS